MCVGFGSVWMMSNHTLMRISLADNAITEIPIEGDAARHHRIAVGEGAVWISDNASQTIYKFDPETNLVTMKIPADFPTDNTGMGIIGVGQGAVWAITGPTYNPLLRRYSAQSGAEEAAIPLPSPSSGSTSMVVDFGSVWAAGTRDRELYRIEPATNQIIAIIALQSRPIALASGEGAVWVLEGPDGTVQRIEGSSNKLLASIAIEPVGTVAEMTVGGGFVWMTSHTVPLVQVDPKTNSGMPRLGPAPGGADAYQSVVYGGGSLWVSGMAIFRIRPPE
jgi:streptogramin lyase